MSSRGEAVQSSELLMIQALGDFSGSLASKVGKNMMESVDLVAQEAALQGTNIYRAAGRASLDAGTTGHNVSEDTFARASLIFNQLKVPGFPGIGPGGVEGSRYGALMHPGNFHELIIDSGDIIVNIAQYQNQDIVLNFELASLGEFALIVNPWAKVFYGAGADNANNQSTSLLSQSNALATTATVSAAAHLDAGLFLSFGTEETGNTFYPTNERVRWVSTTTSVITFVGEGPNGGLRFDHSTSDLVRNADSVYTIAFGGPESLAKVFATEVGEFGQMVGPKRHGSIDQFESLGWKWYGGYGLLSENRLLRFEGSVRSENVTA